MLITTISLTKGNTMSFMGIPYIPYTEPNTTITLTSPPYLQNEELNKKIDELKNEVAELKGMMKTLIIALEARK